MVRVVGRVGPVRFYEASDWGLAWLTAESISRELSPQPLVVAGAVQMVELPPKAAALGGWLKASTALLATEGDRRRLRLELASGQAPAKEVGGVAEFAEYRRRLGSPAGA